QLPSLPHLKTFADAIDITRRPDISYFWVDWLCIMQDSKRDWHRECPQMCDVYESSYCEITATPAMDGAEGRYFE
ncbi:HET-domain-containing protein, partial [Zopfia rhizophila CBS 207.26]